METKVNPYVESRFKRMIIPCPLCKKPMAEREGNRVWVLKRQGGNVDKTGIEVVHHDGNGRFTIRCACGGASIFVSLSETIGINDEIDGRLT